MNRHDFASGPLAASVLADGAELCSLAASGHEMMWQAAPVWPRHAPVLFPIVGRLAHDHLRHGGQTYPMSQHGFARDAAFDWLERTRTGCVLVLSDTEATRRRYPFAFRLEIAYELRDAALHMEFRITNPGDAILPASVGAHPAFRWPLFDGIAKTEHGIAFEQEEPAGIGRLQGGLLLPDLAPTPIRDARLRLSPDLFSGDAIIIEHPNSRWARLGVPDGRGIRIAWAGMDKLGIWSRPADFICIEPWHGIASPVGFDGDFATKPGLMLIPPGAQRRLTMTITPEF